MAIEASQNPWLVTVSAPVSQMTVTRRDKNGELFRDEPDEARDQLRMERKTVPPQGEYTLKLVGISDPFEIPKTGQYSKGPDDKQTVAYFEFEVVKGRNLTGRWFSQRWTRAFGKQATLGQFIKQMTGDYVPYGEPFDLTYLIGKEFVGYVSVTRSESNGKDYPKLNVDTIYIPQAEAQAATNDQRRNLVKAISAIFPEPDEAKEMMRVFLTGAYDKESTKDLSHDQADQALNFFATTPADEVRQLIAEYESAAVTDEDEIGF